MIIASKARVAMRVELEFDCVLPQLLQDEIVATNTPPFPKWGRFKCLGQRAECLRRARQHNTESVSSEHGEISVTRPFRFSLRISRRTSISPSKTSYNCLVAIVMWRVLVF